MNLDEIASEFNRTTTFEETLGIVKSTYNRYTEILHRKIDKQEELEKTPEEIKAEALEAKQDYENSFRPEAAIMPEEEGR